MEDTKGRIYLAIPNIMKDIGVVAKDKVNKQQGFKFRSIDDVYNALHPALVKNKVFIRPKAIEQAREIRISKSGTEMVHVICNVTYDFCADDGSSIEVRAIGEGLDTGDKATNKAMSMAYKYACFQVFCIPTEDMIDADEECLELEQEGKQEKKTTQKAGSEKSSKKASKVKEQPEEVGELSKNAKISEDMLNAIRAEQARTGATDEQILGRKSVKAERMEELTVKEFEYIMGIFKISKTASNG